MAKEEEDVKAPFGAAWLKDTLLAPIRIALSPALLRAYLRTALILITSIALFGAAVIGYLTFYHAYIPIRGIAVPVYLQFDHPQPLSAFGVATSPPSHPYGIANVENLVSRQKYKVVAELVMPRSRKNLNAGNWMMGLELRGPTAAGGAVKNSRACEEDEGIKAEKPLVLARSRRPAIMTYRSWVTEAAHRLLRLPLYVIGWGHESETVRVAMMENVEFAQGVQNIPSSLRLEVRSSAPLDVYRATVHLEANLEGLRWLMYHHWVISFGVFTGLFWAVEMAVVLITWATLTLGSGSGYQEDAAVKKVEEEGDEKLMFKSEESSTSTTPLSDTSRTFPALPSHQPLHFSTGAGPGPSRGGKAKEERVTPGLEDIPAAARTGAEADDEGEENEEEDADFVPEEPASSSAARAFTDSGIGTSVASGHAGEPGVRRRRSGKGKGRGDLPK
ncbi:uncharacterized protein EI97DRAFT_435513 [Westerdykella ornata]|uniref:Adipose-regulatory protein-domain-containing protein n=1 Tax=Westerdykella ornata TaxID=318751 RepID=A0A6A6JC09_WESOR|nr:uncharacterized protein EI97DRAFT_435513 [Westerdykella ornata]KAF2274150.1 hypothetical protein EI97DRAFT_435513 [Westerdykella ornata]